MYNRGMNIIFAPGLPRSGVNIISFHSCWECHNKPFIVIRFHCCIILGEVCPDIPVLLAGMCV